MHKQLFVLLAIFVMSPVCSMELSNPVIGSMLLLTQDVARNKIQPLLSFQDISRLKRSSRTCNTLYDVEPICSLLLEDTCSTNACNRLANNYYACTKALAHCAYKNDEEMFKHLWVHHAEIRNGNIAEHIKKKSEITIKKKMDVYCKHYRESRNIRRHIFKYADKAIRCSNVDFANAVLSGSNLDIFDFGASFTVLEKVSKNCFNFDFIFSQACDLQDVHLINNLCGGAVDSCSFNYIINYANGALLFNLIIHGILPVDTVGKLGKSVLHHAAENGFKHVIQIALENGAYVNCTDSKGMTPLHYATKKAHIEAVLMLLTSEDADVRFANKKGKKVIDYALSVGNYWFDYGDKLTNRETIRRILQSHLEQHTVSAYSDSKVHDNGYQKLHKLYT